MKYWWICSSSSYLPWHQAKHTCDTASRAWPISGLHRHQTVSYLNLKWSTSTAPSASPRGSPTKTALIWNTDLPLAGLLWSDPPLYVCGHLSLFDCPHHSRQFNLNQAGPCSSECSHPKKTSVFWIPDFCQCTSRNWIPMHLVAPFLIANYCFISWFLT